ncbi:MAG TPA: hypothetical protein PKD90_17075 [Phnomibacter sp.]|nr:hypothetical protein [Phnomibacter sp.]
MSKAMKTTLLVCCAIPFGFGLMFAIQEFLSGTSRNESIPIFGLCFIIAGAIYILPAIILAIINNTRQVGLGMLLASGLLLLVGFSLCTIQPVNFH